MSKTDEGMFKISIDSDPASEHVGSTTKADRPRYLVINPNSTESFTKSIADTIRPIALAHHFDVDCISFRDAPTSINSETSSVLSTATALRYFLSEARGNTAGADLSGYAGYVVACYSMHPLVRSLKEVLPYQPVIGIFEASLIHAVLSGSRFGIVTTEKRWEPLLTNGIDELGYSKRSEGVISVLNSVLEAESLPKAEVVSRLSTAALELVQQRGADVICLGCAGFAGLEKGIREAVGDKVTIVDGLTAAVSLLHSMYMNGVKTAKAGVYADLRSSSTD